MTAVQQSLDVHHSVMVVRNLLRLSLSTIAYLRNFFSDECFVDKRASGGLRIKSLIGTTAQSQLMIDWLERGVFDAFDARYLRVFTICVFDGKVEAEDRLLEAYDFHIGYDDNGGSSLSMSTNTSQTIVCRTKEQAVEEMGRMMRRLIMLTQSLGSLPDDHVISMRLQYYEDRTPPEYEPPFFKAGNAAMRRSMSDAGKSGSHMTIHVAGFNTRYHGVNIQVRAAEAIVPTTASSEGVDVQPSAAEQPTTNTTTTVPDRSSQDAAAAGSSTTLLRRCADLVTALAPLEQLCPEDAVAIKVAAFAAAAGTTTPDELVRTSELPTSIALTVIRSFVREGFFVPPNGTRRNTKHTRYEVAYDETASAFIRGALGHDELMSLLPSSVGARLQEVAVYGPSGVAKRERDTEQQVTASQLERSNHGVGAAAGDEGCVDPRVSVIVDPLPMEKRRKIH